MKTTAIAIWLGLLVGPGIGRAAESDAFAPGRPSGFATESASAPARAGSHQPRSPGKAARLSLLATLAPLCIGMPVSNGEGSAPEIGGSVAVAGILLGPSVGYFYGGCGGRGAAGIAVRVGFAGLAAIAATRAEWPTMGVFGSSEGGNAAAGLTVVAAAIVLADTALDLAQVSGTVRRENERHGLRLPSATPLLRVPFGSRAPAVGLSVRF